MKWILLVGGIYQGTSEQGCSNKCVRFDCSSVGCSQPAVVNIYQKSKEGTMNQQKDHGGLKITEGNKGWPVWSCPRDELKLQKSCDRQVSEFTVNPTSLHMGLQTGQGARADPRPPLKVPTMGRWALELDNGKMEDALGNVLLGMLGRWLNVVPDWCIHTIHVVARIAFSNCLCSSEILKVSVCWDFLAEENP